MNYCQPMGAVDGRILEVSEEEDQKGLRNSDQ